MRTASPPAGLVLSHPWMPDSGDTIRDTRFRHLVSLAYQHELNTIGLVIRAADRVVTALMMVFDKNAIKMAA